MPHEFIGGPDYLKGAQDGWGAALDLPPNWKELPMSEVAPVKRICYGKSWADVGSVSVKGATPPHIRIEFLRKKEKLRPESETSTDRTH